MSIGIDIYEPLIVFTAVSRRYFLVSIFSKCRSREEFIEADRRFLSNSRSRQIIKRSIVSTEFDGVSLEVSQKDRPFCGSRLFVETHFFSDDTRR